MTHLTAVQRIKRELSNPLYVIPFVSGIAYVIAYSFEATYLAYFGVGHQFVEIAVNTFVLSAALALLIVVYFISFVGEFNFYLQKVVTDSHKYSSVARYVSQCIPVIVFVAALCIYYGIPLEGAVAIAGLTALMIAFIPCADWLGAQILKFVNVKFDNLTDSKKKKNPQNELLKFLNKMALYVALIMLSAISVGIISGRIYAQTRFNFLSYSNKGMNYILVRDYKERLVFTSIDQRKKVDGNVLIMNNDNPLSLKQVKIQQGIK